MAQARCGLPQPPGPTRINHPLSSRAHLQGKTRLKSGRPEADRGCTKPAPLHIGQAESGELFSTDSPLDHVSVLAPDVLLAVVLFFKISPRFSIIFTFCSPSF